MTISTQSDKTSFIRHMRRMLRDIESLLSGAMRRDRQAILRQIARIRQTASEHGPSPAVTARLAQLRQKLDRCIEKKSLRTEKRPRPSDSSDLPISSKKQEIIDAITTHQVVIISGETGSGKTTRLPGFCLEAGRGIDGLIGCTQPRRIAAVSVARRIAEELGEDIGRSVGYKIRFQDETGPGTYIKIMTDGILLAETQGDPQLNAYDTIIVDEAHERSLNIDFILGILKQLLVKRRDLKLIITSATIDTEKFSRHFDGAPVIEVSGRMYPVDVQYMNPEDLTDGDDDIRYVDMAVSAVERITAHQPFGDILIFMPTEQDIRETCELIEGRNFRGVEVLPLFARLSASEQSRIFSRRAARKIIVATNIAETSITIPGIKYVIDTGLARISQYSPRTRTTALPVAPISRSSADQRKGRCGRIENGICIRLYPEDDYLARPLYTPPEILRTNLAEVILRMISLKLGDISRFPFIDSPSLNHIHDGFDLLTEIGAISPAPRARNASAASRHRLTSKGTVMARLPIDPRLSRMLIEAHARGCIQDMAVIVAALSIQDPRERPADNEADADRIHARFNDPASDFISLLNIWNQFHDARKQLRSTSQMRKFCKAHFLSFRRMREWRDIHAQITDILEESELSGLADTAAPPAESSKPGFFSPGYTAIHQSILSGFLSNIAVKKDKNIYQAAKGKQVMIFPGSGLFNKAGNWIMAAEMIETSRIFARTVADIDPGWAHELGRDLCRTTWLEPHWERSRGEVVAIEQVSLYGLIICSGRRVSYGSIHPEQANDIFITSALIEGDIKKPFAFMEHNRRHMDDIVDMENRLRRRDLLISETQLFDFYKHKLPGVFDIRTLQKLIRQNGGDGFLRLTREDLLRCRPDDTELSLYPDHIDLGSGSFRCRYRFDPGKADDGVTVSIPSSSTASVRTEAIGWLVPGLLKEKITALIKTLPKSYRRQLVPVAATVDIIMDEMPRDSQPLITALCRFIHTRFKVDIPASAWTPESVPDHLKLRIAVTGPEGDELRTGRDLSVLQEHISAGPPSDRLNAIKQKWEISGITAWDFGDLPDSIHPEPEADALWEVFPALEAKDSDISLRLFTSRPEAIARHTEGVSALFCIHLSRQLKFLKKQLALPASLRREVSYFGGPAAFEKQLFDAVVHDLFARNIRTRDRFYAHAESAAPAILSAGQEKLDHVIAVICAYHQLRTSLYDLEQANRTRSTLLEFFSTLRQELDQLIPPHFIRLYDNGKLAQLPRYLKAMDIRANRCILDFQKDQARAEEIKAYSDSLHDLLAGLNPATSDEKRNQIEAFFWMIEEYKVSVFAQEVKTAFPVSAKRLDKHLADIRRMI